MLTRIGTSVAVVMAVFATGLVIGERVARAQTQRPNTHVYEIRTYTAGDGKWPALLKRFRDHELPIFEKNGMHAILYSVAAEPPLSADTFVYIRQHESRESAKAGWQAFLADPEFRKAVGESDQGGRAVVKVDSIFVNPTDFSPLQ